MTVGELGARMSSAEFTDWMAFLQIDGWIQERLAKDESPSTALEYANAMHRLVAEADARRREREDKTEEQGPFRAKR